VNHPAESVHSLPFVGDEGQHPAAHRVVMQQRAAGEGTWPIRRSRIADWRGGHEQTVDEQTDFGLVRTVGRAKLGYEADRESD
jgi:hypothetical protein